MPRARKRRAKCPSSSAAVISMLGIARASRILPHGRLLLRDEPLDSFDEETHVGEDQRELALPQDFPLEFGIRFGSLLRRIAHRNLPEKTNGSEPESF